MNNIIKYNKYNNCINIFEYSEKTKLYNNVNNYFNNLERNMKTIYLTNDNFKNGSYRITTSGIYKLNENITFSPNPDNNFFPTKQQFNENIYPKKPFHLGFFAAIVIETNNVIVDLNGHFIEMSPDFKLHQRFFNAIELSNAPFIPKQGPGDFNTKNNKLKGICVKNGELKNLSHNGIHGNNGEMIYLYNLDIHDFEVSGIQLNGYHNSIIENCIIHNTSTDVNISALFSNALFARLISKNIKECQNESNNLNKDIELIIECIHKNLPVPSHCKYLINELKIPDCNITGIVLNTIGVAINDFKKNRENADEYNNCNILLKDISIHNLVSNPIETLGISKNKNYNKKSESYSNKVQVGPVGDVFPIISLLKNNNQYYETNLSKLQIELAKYNNNIGTNTISKELIDFTSNKIKLEELLVLNENEDINSNIKYHLRGNLDIMSHTMKGNMGLFISAINKLYMDNIDINGVYNNGLPNNKKYKNFIYEDEYRGNQSIGIMITGSENINSKNINIKNIISKTGKSHIIKKIGENKNIIM